MLRFFLSDKERRGAAAPLLLDWTESRGWMLLLLSCVYLLQLATVCCTLAAHAVSTELPPVAVVPNIAPRMMQSIKVRTAHIVENAFNFIIKVPYSIVFVIAQFGRRSR